METGAVVSIAISCTCFGIIIGIGICSTIDMYFKGRG